MSRPLMMAMALAACGGPKAPEPIRGLAVATAPPAQIVARYHYRDLVGWTDIAVDGVDDVARRTCEAAVQRAIEQPVTNHPLEVVRACGDRPLPELHGTHLVERRTLDDTADFLAEKYERSGTVTERTPYASAAECKRVLDMYVVEIEKVREEMMTATRRFIEEQIEVAERAERTACDRVSAAKAKTCAANDSMCDIQRDADLRASVRDCDEERLRVETLRARPIEPPPMRDVRCVST
jgi:hypothetical protein